MNNKKISIIIIAILVISVGSFYAGMKYSQIKRNFSGRVFNSGNRTENMMRDGVQIGQRISSRGALGGIVNGEIISKDSTGITIKLRDGGSRILFVSDKTTISKLASSSLEDLKNGLEITGIGTPNSDGSLNAENIQIK